MSSVTFVTCFLDIYEESEIVKTTDKKTIENRLFYFKELASTGIQICLYISTTMEELIKPIINEYKNIKYKIINFKDLKLLQVIQKYNASLPINRCMIKDSFEYITLMNSKIEFMDYAIQENPWNSTHFAWIDFSIFYIIKNPTFFKKWLQFLSSLTFQSNFLTFPGCFSHKKPFNKENDDLNKLLNNIYWRFCGTFFIGDKDSILQLYELYNIHFPLFLEIYGKLVWEVNFWSWLESFADWKPIWYSADHNDSILQISSDYYSENMSMYVSMKKKYNYPNVHGHNPGSASYIEYQGRKILNTRYVNYIINDDGCYLYYSDKRIINTLNYLSILDDEYNPMNYIQMEENIQLTDCLDRAKNFVTKGLEDIRLYVSSSNILKCIASTVQYSPLGKNRMVIGNYDIENNQIHSVYLIEPPIPDTWCEKNWIPIQHPNIKEDCFIYSWNPFQIGKVVEGNTSNPEFSHKLEIIINKDYNFPFINKIRGSSCFIPYNDNTLIGVVHYSEEYHPRHYYHMLIQVDIQTLSIVEISQPFYFQKIGIEFCIGFTINSENNFCFWISQVDRDPLFITLPSTCFRWTTVK